MRILIAESAGVCFGVERALNLSDQALREKSTVASLGPLIHNPQVVDELGQRGLQIADDIASIPAGMTVVFRSHGVPVSVQNQAKQLGLNVVDATCPLVKVPQNFARKLSQAGYFVVIVGDSKHPEVIGVKSFVAGDEGIVITGPEEIDKVPSKRTKIGVICQTTLKASIYDEVVEKLRLRHPEVKAHNTICSATRDRQAAVKDLAPQVECMVVIGGRHSSNTQKLVDICRLLTRNAYLVETPLDLQPQWFEGVQTVGLTAGASTPHSMIFAIRAKIADIARSQGVQAELIDPSWSSESGAH